MISIPEDVEEIKQMLVEHAYANGLVLVSNQSVIHAPFYLFPSRFPRGLFSQARDIAPLFNALMFKVASDVEFLKQHLGSADSFTRRLLSIAVKHHSPSSKNIECAVLRSDYMVGARQTLQQVELNTIAASFGGLSPRVSRMHQFLAQSVAPHQLANLPENQVDSRVPEALHRAHQAYGVPGSALVFLVQPGERNKYDQLHYQYTLVSRGVKVLRRTFDEMAAQSSLRQGALYLEEATQVSLVYFRAGYTPNDYTREEHWQLLEMLESSRAIMVPNTRWHLAGTKKVQQVLAQPGALLPFIGEAEAARLSACFAGIFALSEESIGRALASPQQFVLKPQREGGGNNLYGEEMTSLLATMSQEDRGEYILMELIVSTPQENVVLRDNNLTRGMCVSELGIYSTFVHDGEKTLVNEAAGHLLRTKGSTVREAGVSAGFGAFDSPFLVDQ